jgi:hypothetical protein
VSSSVSSSSLSCTALVAHFAFFLLTFHLGCCCGNRWNWRALGLAFTFCPGLLWGHGTEKSIKLLTHIHHLLRERQLASQGANVVWYINALLVHKPSIYPSFLWMVLRCMLYAFLRSPRESDPTSPGYGSACL